MRIVAATRLVKAGQRMSLGRIIDANIPVFPGRWGRQTTDMRFNVWPAPGLQGDCGGWVDSLRQCIRPHFGSCISRGQDGNPRVPILINPTSSARH